MQQNWIIIFSLINLGFFGGFSHCAGMCGPFVLTQVSNRLQNTSLEGFSQLKKLQNIALLPYHFGRITTYAIIGFFCSFFVKNLQNIAFFKNFSAFLMIFASFFFLQKFFEKKLLRFSFKYAKINIKFDFLKKLFQNPTGFNGFLLGLTLGFIPCGLLYGAFALAATIENYFLAALAMFLFGLATTPSLFITGLGWSLFFKADNIFFRIISKIVILFNALLLFLLGILSFKL